MFRPLVRSHRRPPRRGTAILITCFFLITTMMVTGLALLMYAAREKAAALAYQDAVAGTARPTPDPQGTVNAFLGALIYDVGDGDLADGSAVDPNSRALQNALRGHSIARGMYGSRADYTTPANPWVGSTTPWAGVGLFNEDGSTYTSNGTAPYPALSAASLPSADQRNRARFVNHTALPLNNQLLLLDPERVGNRFATGGPAQLPTFASTATRAYVGKHAGYTYPDLKSFFLGARDPYTGEVIQPSFHRDWQFRDASQPAGQSSLHPSNPNWTNEVGKLLTLRPRPQEHPNFPRVPPNADGSYTGDVQNLTGNYVYVPSATAGQPGRFVARNDSLWMHIGLPPITLPDGRTVQPLVAPLILPLDGLYDLSIHGNLLGASSAHSSYGGYGPWEVNLGKNVILEAERQALARSVPATPAGRVASRNSEPFPFAAGQLLPNYGGVAWDGTAVQFQLPTANSMLGLPSLGNPTFAPAFGGFQNNNAQVTNHPAGYDSNMFGVRNNTTNLTSPVYPFTDLKRFSLRYAFTPDWYNQAFATQDAPTTFLGTPATYAYIANPGATTSANYRLDPAHTLRNLFGPRAMSLDRPALAPNFRDRGDGTALAIAAGATKPGPLFAAAAPYPSPQAVGAITDFAGQTRWYNIQAALGSVNLNRPLADYRNDLTTPLSATNATNAAQAEADRQALARDIFARLIVATGAAAQVDPATGAILLPDPDNANQIATTPPTTATVEQYNALRYLAQLAVNIVDYIDNDDVSTTFEWNKTGTVNYASPTGVGNRVVFGIEKPRLVLNEVYGEITNAPGDPINGPDDGMGGNQALPANADAHVKFWAELVNATSAPHTAATGVLGNGSVALNAYQIQISRANRMTGPAAQAGDLGAYMSNPANTTGRLGDPAVPATAQPDATFTLAPVAPQPTTVSPNDVSLGAQQYEPAPANLPAGGFVLVGPPQADKMGSKEFTPPNTGVWAAANKVESAAPTAATTSLGMGYTFTMPGAATLSSTEFKRHVVLLRRLANPYLPVNDPNVAAPAYNPALPLNAYVTVDVMDYVPAFDAVHRAAGGMTDRNPWDMTNNPNGYDPVANRFSVGKVQPLAGLSVATLTNGKGMTGGYNVYNNNAMYAVNSSLTASMVRDQTAAPRLPVAPTNPNEPKNTFGRHNGHGLTVPAGSTVNAAATPATLTETIMLPFDWQIHMDRPLETLGDAFFVRDCPPHRLTTEFVQPSATAPSLRYDTSYARWAQHNDGLARALALLSVKSPALGVAHGGRVGGRMNLNVVQDQRIVDGIWDAPAAVGATGNQFDQNFVTNNVWSGLIASRSPLQQKYATSGAAAGTQPVPTSSVLDVPNGATSGGGTDRPLMPFGMPSVGAGPGFAYANPNIATDGSNDGDTILRRNLTATPQVPYLYNTAQTHPYLQTEPLRKVMNNVTTTSQTFVVFLTIGYFEVTTTTPGWLPTNVNNGQVQQFGAEVYNDLPGDMRQKYIAVIDMSNMALKPVFPTAATDTDPHATGQPFFTALTATARAGANVPLALASGGWNAAASAFQIPADGQTVTVNVGDTLILGYGSEAQQVVVSAVNPQLTVTTLARDAWGGTCVSNVRPGYAGPRTDFDYNSAKYKPVVPYVERLK